MPYEISEELFEAMKNLSGKDWDDTIQAWKDGEAEKLEYKEQYYRQIDNLNLGNRTFHERNRLPTPDEKTVEVDQRILKQAKQKEETD